MKQLGDFPLFNNSKTNIMKTKTLFAAMAACVMMTSCSSNDMEEQVSNNQTETVTISFPQFQQTIEPMTRTNTDVSTLVTHIDVWLTDGTTTTDVHQVSTDANFGTVSVELTRNKTYTMYAVAHKADGATMADGIIAFTNDKVTHSMFYTTQFNTSTTNQLSCEMKRIVGMFRLETTDAVPNNVAKVQFIIPQTCTRWSVSGVGANKVDRTSEITVSSKNQDGTASFNIYIIGSDIDETYDITVKALDANNNVVTNGERTFSGVTIRNNYKTIYSGAFFSPSTLTSSFVVSDWETFESISF